MSTDPLVGGLRIGHAHDLAARTGCTVLLGPFRAAVDVRGMATGSRELYALSVLHVAPAADAILLSGGSAFGLAAADGVSEWLEEHGHGFFTPYGRVPIVAAAVLFDLGVGSPAVRPGPAMGRAACEAASAEAPAEGRVGAGTGATVGKVLGPAAAMPGGFGCATSRFGEWTLTAVAAVNALGDVRAADGRIIAGARGADGAFVDSAVWLRKRGAAAADLPEAGTSTTLVAVVTDAPASRPELEALARMAATALARRITPVHTPIDGDVTFAASTSTEAAGIGAVALLGLGSAATDALERALERAVTEAA
ncbi:MAG TPA: P1 family peptidase [Longimicrobiales bacterium]|nr:P1 family peptidase [Longimicrobiales bacterium]